MQLRQEPRAGRRNLFAFAFIIVILGAITLFAAAASAAVPTGIPTAGKAPAGGTPSPTPTGCIQTWNVVDSPSPYNYSELLAVDALSDDDVWAVGTGLVEHWDGSSWTVLTDTLPITFTTQLWGVAAVSTNDIWAVGRGDGAGHAEGVIIHWNGNSWTRVPNPNPGIESSLFGVTSLAANDVWAVGYEGEYNSSNALAMHWDGVTWSAISPPLPPFGAYQLKSVSGVASDDVWAVGWSSSGALIMHWDGTSWSVIANSFPVGLFGVAAVTSSDVWASGIGTDGTGSYGAIIHWDGTNWAESTTTATGEALYTISAASPVDVWAAGNKGANGTLVMHWDGSAWSTQNSPLPFPYAGELYGVVAISPTAVWAVGDANSGTQSTTLAIHYNRWCPTPIQCATGWNVVDGPNPGSDTNVLFDTDAISASDVWAVGAFDIGDNPMAQHWNGSYWSYVPMDTLPIGTVLYGVKAVSPNDVWTVGYNVTSNRNGQPQSRSEPLASQLKKYDLQPQSPDFTYETFIGHWEGQNWTRIPSPSPSTTNRDSLSAIDGVAATDLWAVGNYQDAIGNRTLILHWDGQNWNQVSSPPGALSGVVALASNDVWAVGESGSGSGSISLTLHWDGQEWDTITSPNPGTAFNALTAVSAVSSNDIWAVGYSQNTTGGSFPVTIHWNGAQWNAVSTPGSAQLLGVSARASNDVWAVGSGGATQSTILHWDGITWTEATHPAPGEDQFSELDDVLAVSSNEVWAVGYIGHYYINTRIERWVGSCETPTVTATVTPTRPTSTATSTPVGCIPTWNVIPSPNQTSNNSLQRVAAVSTDDIWAVGAYDDSTSGTSGTLVEHWDGTAWSIVPSPNQGIFSYLWSVAAVSANDVWAVGGYRLTSNGTNETLVEHWDGTAWSIVPSPNQGSGGNYLDAVASLSANDIWAVGHAGSQILIEHWDGTVWSIVPSPNGGSQNALLGVTAVSSSDVWAVGYSDSATLVEHWNGTAWSIMPSPNPGLSMNYLDAVTTVSSSDVWAVGYLDTNGVSQTLVEHWDGTTWSVVPSPNPGLSVNQLYAVAAKSANDVWAVGLYQNSSPSQTLVEHWNGTTWSVVSSPSPGASNNGLLGVVALSAYNAWAVGDYSDTSNPDVTLVEHYTVCSPTVSPTSVATNSPTPTPSRTNTTAPANSTTPTRTTSPTNTPGGPTATRTVAMTAVASPTSCTIQFTDVPEGSTFYSYIRCLACRGIINGYPDGTFKPNNLVTRGQLSKIVSNAVGFSDPQTAQMFEDVPVGSTFFDFIGRLASRGFISGYPCGGPGEPCMPPGNLPYFRPGGTATRGQLTKIAANAEGFNQPVPTGQQTFTDVTPGSTFYLYVERLLMSRPGVMSGYPCGGPGEPCDSLHRPYFRPNNSVTRGQTAKIVANSVFPSCSP